MNVSQHPPGRFEERLLSELRRVVVEEPSASAGARKPTPRPGRFGRKMSLALAGSVLAAVATVVIVLVLVVAPGGSNRLDVVAEARAALPDRGDLVHLVTVTRQ